MKIHDISVLVHPNMPIYPGDPGVTISHPNSKALGDPANVSFVCLGVHTGTHVDAPWHVESSWPPLQDLGLDTFVGSATVFELGAEEAITAHDLRTLPWEGVERVLFKTRNSQLWGGKFHEDFVHLDEGAAQFLAQNTKVRLVGIDYLSIEKFGSEMLAAHKELLGQRIVVIEGLDLSRVSPGQYDLVCLPLKLASEDGAPARAILMSRQ